MPESTQFFADRPDVSRPDALSELLRSVRLYGVRAARYVSEGPFSEHVADRRLVYLAVSTGLTVRVGDADVPLAPADMVLLARGDEHLLHGTGATEWVRGEFDVDSAVADPVLSVLPPLIRCAADDPGAQWLPLSLYLLLDEAKNPRPGGDVMSSRILELLFIHALRHWAATGSESNPGWLTAAMDPNIGPALTAVHAHPDRPWTVAELAEVAMLSRSAFAARFTRLLGVAPSAYVTDRRLDRAAELLRESDLPVGEVGRAVGYGSEAGFSRAFSRRYGASPRRWRSGVDG
ncbi:AraC family transcriptional regulator [Tsukamurella strandjordii]|uniref:AraC family transcriptional regulator n=1 Tax=Tsukamurella strandjordii TaxID=147577 RepID=UPI0031E48031